MPNPYNNINSHLDEVDVNQPDSMPQSGESPEPTTSDAALSHEAMSISKAFAEHRDVLAGYFAQKMLRPSDIEDLLQETFLRSFQACRGKIINSPKGYLFITARNLLSRRFAKQSRTMLKEISDLDLNNIADGQVQADMQLHYRLKMDLLSEAVESLPPQCRRVFIMRKIEGKTHKQIAKDLNISTSTVERHITIALTRLNTIMQSKGYNQGASNRHKK